MNIFVILFVIFVCFDGVVHGQGFGQLIKSIGLMRTIYERCGVSQSTFCTNGGRPVAFPMFEDSCPKNGDKYGPRPGHLEIPNFQDLFNERGSPCVNDVLVDEEPRKFCLTCLKLKFFAMQIAQTPQQVDIIKPGCDGNEPDFSTATCS
jgi:hypothetical protein